MYSGITRGLFPVVAVSPRNGTLHLSVRLSAELCAGLQLGASVSIDGVCLSVVELAGTVASFDAVAETLSRSTLSELQVGREVSVERSCKVGDELGGHDVFGHVIGTATIVAREHHGAQLDLTLSVPAAWLRFILHKGFIALDGSSLTVGNVTRDAQGSGRFDVHLIPETLRVTGFAKKRVGDRVNVELDARTVAIVETVERVLSEHELKV